MPIENGNSADMDPAIKKAETSKQVLKQKVELYKDYSQRCKVNFDKAVKQAKDCFKMNNVEGALMYCVTAIRQKKFEKRHLLKSDQFNAIIQRIDDTIMNYNIRNGLNDEKEAFEAMAALNNTDKLDDTVGEIRKHYDTFSKVEEEMSDALNNLQIGSDDSDKAMALELFRSLREETIPDVAKEGLENFDTSKDTSQSCNASMLSPL